MIVFFVLHYFIFVENNLFLFLFISKFSSHLICFNFHLVINKLFKLILFYCMFLFYFICLLLYNEVLL